MTFKSNWEKTDQRFQIEIPSLKAMISLAFPKKTLSSCEVISGGCANLNVKIHLKNESDPFILRIYLRDKDAAHREHKLSDFIKESIPIPEVYFVGDLNGYRFAVTQYKQGITLRDLLLNSEMRDREDIMREVGLILEKIQSYQFPHSGFFDHNLNIKTKLTRDDYATFAKNCLSHQITLDQIAKEHIAKIHTYLDRYHSLLPDENQHRLVHADYDPANILVREMKGRWVVSAILDWEFAFSGSPLCDVANMLRYAHHMPPSFETSFLEGLQQGGVQLAANWRITIYLLNLLSLLDCLTRCSPKERPNQCADIHKLIAYILKNLDKLP